MPVRLWDNPEVISWLEDAYPSNAGTLLVVLGIETGCFFTSISISIPRKFLMAMKYSELILPLVGLS
jgi:hypothetical protein